MSTHVQSMEFMAVFPLPLTHDNLITVFNAYQTHPSHDDLLFITQSLTGFDCLMHLGELTWARFNTPVRLPQSYHAAFC